MEKLAPPVVMEKPIRGREMQTTAVPTDMFENLAPEHQKPKEGTGQVYHEGFIDGRKYLVPDSNLEAMKDIINFKMRPRKSTRYKHQTSYDVSDYDHFRGKLDGLLFKFENLEDLKLTPSELDEAKLNKKPLLHKESTNEESEKSTSEESEEESQVSSEKESDEPEEKTQHLKLKTFKDEHHIRFLVSGHFKKDQKPIYIIQEYDGSPDIFKNQKKDFFSKKKAGNVDVLISGKFFNENILEELNGKPVALRTKPNKIIIEDEKSKVYYDYFQDTYKMKNVDITLKGEFIRSKLMKRVTPFLTLHIKNKSIQPVTYGNSNYNSEKENFLNANSHSKTVLVYKPKYQNPFSQDFDHYKYEDTDKISRGNYTLNDKAIKKEFITEVESSKTINSLQQASENHSTFTNGFKLFGETQTDESTTKMNQTFSIKIKESKEFFSSVTGLHVNLKSKEDVPQKKSHREGFFKMLRENSLYKSIFGKRNIEENNEKGMKEQHKSLKKKKKSIKATTKGTPIQPKKVSSNVREKRKCSKNTLVFDMAKAQPDKESGDVTL